MNITEKDTLNLKQNLRDGDVFLDKTINIMYEWSEKEEKWIMKEGQIKTIKGDEKQ